MAKLFFHLLDTTFFRCTFRNSHSSRTWALAPCTRVIRFFSHIVDTKYTTCDIIIVQRSFTDYYYNNVQLKLPSYVPATGAPFFHTQDTAKILLLTSLHFVRANTLAHKPIKYATASQFVVFLFASFTHSRGTRKLETFAVRIHSAFSLYIFVPFVSAGELDPCTLHSVL